MPVNDQAPRNRKWLLAYAHQLLPDCRRIRRYLNGVAQRDLPLDLTDPGPDPKFEQDAYDISRAGCGLLGRKTFEYVTPQAKKYMNPDRRAEVMAGLRTFADKQDRQGRFIWGNGSYYGKGTHEHVWRLEPLIWSRLWLEYDLNRNEKQWIDRMIQRAAPYLLKMPRIDNSNQGIVWCYGCWLAGLYLGNRKYIDTAEQHADGILEKIVDEQGQVIEASARYYRGGGPCSNYTYTGWTYIMMYRLISGRTRWDERLLKAMRWLAMIHARNGLPMAVGPSVRRSKTRVAISDTLHGFEFFGDREPFFQTVVDRFLPEALDNRQGHCLSPFIWAAKAHRPAKRKASIPKWYGNFEQHYETPPSQYFVVSHRYQTAVTLRGLFPYKGLQTFACGNEPPIIHPAMDLASTVQCGRIDIASENIHAGPAGWEVHHRRRTKGDADQSLCRMTSLTTRRGDIWECYVFTNSSVIYVVGGGRAKRVGRWVLNHVHPSVSNLCRRTRRLSFEKRKAEIHYHAGRAKISNIKGHSVFEVTCNSKLPLIIGFGADDLKLEMYSSRQNMLRFRDATGHYSVSFNSILAEDGTLRRWWGNIVKPAERPSGGKPK